MARGNMVSAKQEHCVLFAHGFLVYGVEIDVNGTPVSDKQVDDLWQRYLTANEDMRQWSNVSEIITTALRLIPDIRQFFENQATNGWVHGINEAFLYDIARFLTTGRRDLELDNVLSLIEDNPDRSALNKSRSPLDTFPEINKLQGSQYIETWLSWDSGLEDLLTSLYLLFGANRIQG